ncbi:MAG: hypothetical protein V4449_02225 [Patescibacteria group bacterium]
MKKKAFLIVVALVLIFIPLAVFAADSNPSSLLSGAGGGLVPQCEGPECKACDLTDLANNVINFGVAFSVIVATLMFAYAGVLYVTAASSPEQIKKAHGVFTNVFVGLLLVLLAWLLVNILFSVLTGRGLAVWSHVDCIENPTTDPFADVPILPQSTLVTGGAGAGRPSTVASVGTAYSTSAAAIAALERGGVCGGAVPCTDGSSLAGLRVQTVNQLIELHQGCGCQFTVTSGVRLGGAHATGLKVDVRINKALSDYIERTFVPDPRYGGKRVPWGSQEAYVYNDSCGNVYAREYGSQPHWDIEAKRGRLCTF